MKGPGLKPHQRCNPRSYVTERDLHSWEGDFCARHAGELGQWRKSDELSVTALGIAAVLSAFRGLRGGPDGCGVQMTLSGWSRLLGRSRRAVAYAFEQLRAHGWVYRRRRLVKVDWVDANGVQRERADVWGVAYLSRLAAVRIARRGETRRLVLRNGMESRLLTCAGAVGNLLETHRQELRLLAKRVTDAFTNCTPSSKRRTTHLLLTVEAKGAPQGGALAPCGTDPPAQNDGRSTALGSRAQWRGSQRERELQRLWSRRLLTAATAWPDVWSTTDARGRAWLRAEFDRDYRPELGRRLAAETASSVDSAQADLELAQLRERERQALLRV